MVYGMEEYIMRLHDDGYLKTRELSHSNILHVVKGANRMRRENGGPDNLTAKNVGPRPEKRLGNYKEYLKYMEKMNYSEFKKLLQENKVPSLDKKWLLDKKLTTNPKQKPFSQWFSQFMQKSVRRTPTPRKRPIIYQTRKHSPKIVQKEMARTKKNRTRAQRRTVKETKVPGVNIFGALVPAPAPALAPAPAPPAIPPTPKEYELTKYHSPAKGDSPTQALRSKYQEKTAAADPTIAALRSRRQPDGKFSPATGRELAERTATVLQRNPTVKALRSQLQSMDADRTAARLRTERRTTARTALGADTSPTTSRFLQEGTQPSPTGR